MFLMAWRSSRGLILASVVIFFNLGSKQAATGKLQGVLFLLQDPLF